MTKRNWIKYIAIPVWNGLLACFLLFANDIICPNVPDGPRLNFPGTDKPFNANYTWMAFVSWTYFSFTQDRIRAVIDIIVGFFAAYFMVIAGNFLYPYFPVTVFGVKLASVIAGGAVSGLAVWFSNFPKTYLNNTTAIFFGMAMAFSQTMIGWSFTSLKLLGIVIVYGILGLITAYLASIDLYKFFGVEND